MKGRAAMDLVVFRVVITWADGRKVERRIQANDYKHAQSIARRGAPDAKSVVAFVCMEG